MNQDTSLENTASHSSAEEANLDFQYSNQNNEPRLYDIPASPLANADQVKFPLPCATPPSTAATESILGDASERRLTGHAASLAREREFDSIQGTNVRSREGIRSHIHDRGNEADGISIASSNPHNPHRYARHAATMQPPTKDRVHVIWGTNIIISDAIAAFERFLMEFSPYKTIKEEDMLSGMLHANTTGEAPFYLRLLRKCFEEESFVVELDGEHLRSFPATFTFYHQLLHYPMETIQIMDTIFNKVFQEMFPEQSDYCDPIQVRPFNCGKTVNLRELNPGDLDKLISIKGIIIRVSNVIPDMRLALFICNACGQVVTVENSKGHIAEPTVCSRDGCGARNSLTIIHNRCIFGDRQILKIQETPDAIPEGQTPHCVTLCVYDGLIDIARPGDRLEVTGIFRSAPVRANSRQRKSKSIFRTYIDVVHLKRVELSENRFGNDKDQLHLTANVPNFRVPSNTSFAGLYSNDEIIALSQRPDLYNILANSLAPTVWGLNDVKKGLLLQLFGGVQKSFSKTGGARLRGDINILLAGDPGVSKSQLLRYVHKLAPRGIYTSGKGSSAVGLTAYITRDSDSNQLVLESGALVLSDGGICCIDEFDKMSDETRAVLHEVMEQQTVSVAKAGIITTLNARTSVLASANPVDSKYNQSKSIVENLNLPPTILSRFDIIFLVLDNIDVDQDQRLGRHIVSLYTVNANDRDHLSSTNEIEHSLLARYISYARTIKPTITEEASNELTSSYVRMRKMNGNSGKSVSATTRQLESLIRLSEAHARMRLSPRVEKEDVLEAFRLMREAMYCYAIDPLTGKIDMDLVTTGKSNAARERQEELKRSIKNWVANNNIMSIEIDTLAAGLASQSSIFIDTKWLHQALEELIDEGFFSIIGSLKRGSSVLKHI